MEQARVLEPGLLPHEVQLTAEEAQVSLQGEACQQDPLSIHSIDPCNHILTDTVNSNSNNSRGDGVEPISRAPKSS